MKGRTWLPPVVVQLIDRVESRLDQLWSLEDMANEACFSAFHLHRMFRHVTGETPAAFLERLRLERAALLLLAGDDPITTLAADVGFRRPETLTDGWVRRSVGGGLYASLTLEGSGPALPTIHQRLFVWAMAGRHRLRPGATLEMQQGDNIVVYQPVVDTRCTDRHTGG